MGDFERRIKALEQEVNTLHAIVFKSVPDPEFDWTRVDAVQEMRNTTYRTMPVVSPPRTVNTNLGRRFLTVDEPDQPIVVEGSK